MKLNNKKKADGLHSTMKKSWKEPQVLQLNIKQTKNGATPNTFENNLNTKKSSSAIL